MTYYALLFSNRVVIIVFFPSIYIFVVLHISVHRRSFSIPPWYFEVVEHLSFYLAYFILQILFCRTESVQLSNFPRVHMNASNWNLKFLYVDSRRRSNLFIKTKTITIWVLLLSTLSNLSYKCIYMYVCILETIRFNYACLFTYMYIHTYTSLRMSACVLSLRLSDHLSCLCVRSSIHLVFVFK